MTVNGIFPEWWAQLWPGRTHSVNFTDPPTIPVLNHLLPDFFYFIFIKFYSRRKKESKREAPPPITQQRKECKNVRGIHTAIILQWLAFNKSLHCLTICSNSYDMFFGLWNLYFCLYLQLGFLLAYFFLSLILCLHLNQEYKYWT